MAREGKGYPCYQRDTMIVYNFFLLGGVNNVCVCVYEEDLALNNPQALICHKTQPTTLLSFSYFYKYLFFHDYTCSETIIL